MTMAPNPREAFFTPHPFETADGGGIDSKLELTRQPEKKDMVSQGKKPTSLSDWGYPGHLTDAEFNIFEKLSAEVYKRDDKFRSTVFCFDRAHEDEAHALCRWLRARKFNYADTVKLIEEATECRKKAFSNNFYPHPRSALGVEPSIYVSQYPQLYSGHARNGCPLFISKPGVMNVSGVECITTLEGVLNYHWYGMMHDLVDRLAAQHRSDPSFQRYECVCVLDLQHLTTAQLSKRALNIVKVQSQIDSLCFPETLHRMVVVNAPSFFTMTWKVMKSWVDVRTSSKVEIFGTNKKNWTKKLRELVDDNNLPSDYGGTAVSTASILAKDIVTQCEQDGVGKELGTIVRQEEQLLSVRSSATHSVDLKDEESMKLTLFTRSLSGGTLTITGPSGQRVMSGKLIKHNGKGVEIESPTRVDLDVVLKEAGMYKIKIESSSGPFNTENFLLVGRVFRGKQRSHVVNVCSLGVGILKKTDDVGFVVSPSKQQHHARATSESRKEKNSLKTPTATNKKDAVLPGRPAVSTSSSNMPSSVQSFARSPAPAALAMENAKMKARLIGNKYAAESGSVVDVYGKQEKVQKESAVVADDSIPSTGMLCGAGSITGLFSHFCGSPAPRRG